MSGRGQQHSSRGRGRGRDGGRRGGRGNAQPQPSLSPSLSSDFEQKATIQPSPPTPSPKPATSSSAPPPQQTQTTPMMTQQPRQVPAMTQTVKPTTSSSSHPPQPSQTTPMMTQQPRDVPAITQTVKPTTSSSVQGVRKEEIVDLVQPASAKQATRLPVRPGYGKVGKKCLVKANHFLVQVADSDLHHYDVSIDPEVTSKKVCRDIIAELVSMFKESVLGGKLLAYDGRKSAYCAGPLPFASKEFVITLPEKDGPARKKAREFKVTIKFAVKADIHHLMQFLRGRQLDSPQETIQALDVILRAKPSSCYETVGRSFFSPELGQAGTLFNGLEYWKGFYQSLRPTQMGMSLNIDMSARAFYEPMLVTEFVKHYLNRDVTRPLSDQDRLKIKKVLKGVKVEVNHQGFTRRYKVSGLSALPLAELTFVDESGTTMKVVQYFHKKYNVGLRETFFPSIQAGSDAKPVMLPMEICRIVEGQRYTRKLNEKQVTELLRATCQRPEARERSIQEMVKKNNYNGDELVNKEFGIHVTPQLTTIEARVLPAPMLKYHASGGESRVDPRVGQWNMINKKMVNGAKIEFWTCVCFARPSPSLNLDKFCGELVQMCRSKGMDFNPSPLIPMNFANVGQIEKALFDIHKQSAARLDPKKELQLLIVVLPEITGFSYGNIKRICETELGIVTQCCQPRQVSKCNKQYLENLALKINVKTGGRNTVLEQAIQKNIPFLTDRPTIVLGADVTHPAPGEDSSPSIAAVVGSMDWPEVTKYRGLVSAQPHREEIILDLFKQHEDPVKGITNGGMIRELLLSFYRSQRCKPDRIIFYRDGVSEGQFSQVLLHEMTAIRKACVSLEATYLPRVTFIVVQKRHHTRLFPEKHGDKNTTDRSGNILPGTVVDTKICHPTEFDFYLNSHAGIQGTSRPAHYHVLFDENNFTADALQLLTNNLCYTYARCTRSVSIVPPAYYAHLAAFRARYYIEGDLSDSGSTHGGDKGKGKGKATRESTATFRPLPVIKDNVKDVMFYC